MSAIEMPSIALEPDAGIPAVYADPRWYAVWTRSRHEKSVAEQLERKRVETFLPVYESIRQWRNGRHRVQLPLFPAYAFVRIALRDRLEVLTVPGVARLVGFNGTATPLDDEEIEGLRRALAQGVRATPHPFLQVGRRVRITAGPLAGYEGILVRRKGALRVVLSIDLIQRSILLDTDALSLAPVHRGQPGTTPMTQKRGSRGLSRPADSRITTRMNKKA